MEFTRSVVEEDGVPKPKRVKAKSELLASEFNRELALATKMGICA
jgi:hypothetical protein